MIQVFDGWRRLVAAFGGLAALLGACIVGLLLIMVLSHLAGGEGGLQP